MSERWTKADDNELARLLALRWLIADIGRKIGRTERAVKKRMQRIGLKSPRGWTAPAKPRSVPTTEATTYAPTDDETHVRLVLSVGLFPCLPIPWIEPRLKVWRAA